MGDIVLQTLLNLLNEEPKSRSSSVLDMISKFRKWRENEDTTWEFLSPVFKRILRSLGSSKELTRQMYYAVCVSILSVLRQSPALTVANYVELLEDLLKNYPVASKSEEGEAYVGSILAYGALIQAKFMVDPVDVSRVVCRILELMDKKSYLTSVGYTFIKFQVEAGSPEHFKSIEAPLTRNLIDSKDKLTIDHLYVLHVMADVHGASATTKVLGTKKVFVSANVPLLIKCIMEAEKNDHPFITICVNVFLSNPVLLRGFWVQLMETLSQNSHVKKEGRILTLFSSILKSLDQSSFCEISYLLNLSLLKLIITRKPQHKAITHEAFQHMKKDLLLASNSEKIAALNQLFKCGNFLDLDKITGVNLMMKVGSALETESLKELAELYKNIILGKKCRLRLTVEKPIKSKDKAVKGDDSAWTNKEKVAAVHHFARLINSPNGLADALWRRTQLRFLIDIGMFVKEGISAEMASTIIKPVFYSSLSHRLPKLVDYEETLKDLVAHLIHKIKSKDALRAPGSDETVYDTLIKSIEYMEKPVEVAYNDLSPPHIVRLIISYISLWLFKDRKSSLSILLDLFTVYDYLELGEEGKDEKHWTEVLVDTFLHLLSKKESSHRNIINMTFKSFAPHMTEVAINQILEILNPDTTSLNEEDESDEDDSEVDGEDGEESEESETESSSSSDSENLNGFPLVFSPDIQGPQTDEESVDIDTLSEEQSLKLNKELDKLMGSVSNKRPPPETKLNDFRMKALNLLELLYDLSAPPSRLVILSIPCLFHFLVHSLKSNQKNSTVSKLRQVIRKVGSIKKVDFPESEYIEIALQFLKGTLIGENELLTQKIFSEITPEIASDTKYLTRVILACGSSKDHAKLLKLMVEHGRKLIENRPKVLSLSGYKKLLLADDRSTFIVLSELSQMLTDDSLSPFKKVKLTSLLHALYESGRWKGPTTFHEREKLLSTIETNILTETSRVLDNLKESNAPTSKYKMTFIKFLISLHATQPQQGDFWSTIKGQLVRALEELSEGIYRPLQNSLIELADLLHVERDKLQLKPRSEEAPKRQKKVKETKPLQTPMEVTEISGDQEKKSLKKKADFKKLRKEAKIRRMQTLEGLSENFFSGISIDEDIEESD